MTENTLDINRENFVEALTAVVEEAGADYVYPEDHKAVSAWGLGDCQYVFNDVPDCIIGRALVRIGMPIEDLGQFENMPSGAIFSALGVTDSGLTIAARAAQNAQDRGISWGKALEHYHRVLSEWDGNGSAS